MATTPENSATAPLARFTSFASFNGAGARPGLRLAPPGSLCVKQALPHVRPVGESWPLPLDRAFFEHEALVEHGRHAPGLTPAIYHFDPVPMLTVMELLESHIIMWRGMIQGIRYPRAATDMAEHMARTLFISPPTSARARPRRRRAPRKRSTPKPARDRCMKRHCPLRSPQRPPTERGDQP